MVLDWLRQQFAGEQTIDGDAVLQFYREKKASELEQVQQTIQEFDQTAADTIDQIQSQLDTIDDLHDPDKPAVINDVVKNILEDRKKLVADTEIDAEITALPDRLEAFTDTFQTMTRKENEVMKRADSRLKDVFSNVRDLQRLADSIRSFLDGRYDIQRTYNRIDEKIDEIQSCNGSIAELENERDSLPFDRIDDQLDSLRDRLQEIKQDEAWERLDALKEEKKELEKQVKQERASISDPVSRLERGVKKILYQVEHGDLELTEDQRSVLKQLRNGELPRVTEQDTAIQTLPDVVRDNDLLSGRYRQTFLDQLATLKDIPAQQEAIADLEDRIEQKQQEIDEITINETQRQCERDIEAKKAERKELVERRDEITGRIQELRDLIADHRKEIESLLNDVFYDEITIDWQD